MSRDSHYCRECMGRCELVNAAYEEGSQSGIEGRGVEDDDLISRKAAMVAVCSRCARPERYRPAEPMEGSERLWHFQGTDNWNAGQCDAAAIIRLPPTHVK